MTTGSCPATQFSTSPCVAGWGGGVLRAGTGPGVMLLSGCASPSLVFSCVAGPSWCHCPIVRRPCRSCALCSYVCNGSHAPLSGGLYVQFARVRGLCIKGNNGAVTCRQRGSVRARLGARLCVLQYHWANRRHRASGVASRPSMPLHGFVRSSRTRCPSPPFACQPQSSAFHAGTGKWSFLGMTGRVETAAGGRTAVQPRLWLDNSGGTSGLQVCEHMGAECAAWSATWLRRWASFGTMLTWAG